ncbi:alpha/beta hydrolase [Streptomyces spinosirectus]|jgi:pimeloyl-ACP methyl ester carboxylesterase|uniref:alpha/beta fold hydrolase n=1 Tax=Streptomyces TaxID=1883 RepID=UPI000D364C04|nr:MULTISPECIES: alpha/beta hydrolase [Streptomyces]MBY8339195.1 alpha/beta hydrolase [Streptomyces plumbidurans]PTM93995.1 pimeloyl-ACP methyl ester carboxylesterase [Streptomyces sp. VMFN-G11Ma]UIR21969.1 alpha/beta hydrolase [Streptomyces spinosirectus]
MPAHRTIDVNGIRLHIAEHGEGPLVVLLHGFPESWRSWRHQFGPLADAGFRVVAPDQRGYGRSDRPAEVSAYSILHLVGDVVGLIRALGEEQAYVVGHDWGAPVAWHTALLRPDLVLGVAGLSVPPPFRSAEPPLAVMDRRFDGRFYWNYFNRPGVADAEFARDTRTTLRKFFFMASGDAPGAVGVEQMLVEHGRGWLESAPDPEVLPPWFTEADLDALTEDFSGGFTGALNWYRNLDRNWELTAPWHGAVVNTPALYVYGDRDPVPAFTPDLIAALPRLMPSLRREPLELAGCGHWTQQERPDEVNSALVDFLSGLRG